MTSLEQQISWREECRSLEQKMSWLKASQARWSFKEHLKQLRIGIDDVNMEYGLEKQFKHPFNEYILRASMFAGKHPTLMDEDCIIRLYRAKVLLSYLKQVSPEMDKKLGEGLSAEVVKFLETLDYALCDDIDDFDRRNADGLFD